MPQWLHSGSTVAPQWLHNGSAVCNWLRQLSISFGVGAPHLFSAYGVIEKAPVRWTFGLRSSDFHGAFSFHLFAFLGQP